MESNTARSYPIFSTLLIIFGILLTVAYLDYNPNQNTWVTTDFVDTSYAPNLVGSLGATITFWSNYLFGFAAWFIPIFTIWTAFLLMFRKAFLLKYWRYTAMTLCTISFAALLNIIQNYSSTHSVLSSSNYYPNGAGGLFGYLLFGRFLENYLGLFGSSFILTTIYFSSLILTFTMTPHASHAFEIAFKKIFPLFSELSKAVNGKLLSILYSLKKKNTYIKTYDDQDTIAALTHDPKPKKEKKFSSTKSELVLETSTTTTKKELPPFNNELKIIDSEKIEKSSLNLPKRKGNYIFPSYDLLNPAQTQEGISTAEHQQIVDTLIRTLAEFGVNVTPGEVHAGPVITRYEVIPAAGVRVEKILNLDKNIALALKAHSVRILAPVPGKGSVGIEIPNNKPSFVCLREIIESTAWSQSDAEIPLVLGKEVTGKPLVFDLAKMPHLLIAGSTGSGKTVCINTIIASLLYHASPQDIRFIMVDPKIVEMQLYNDLPHMLIPVVTTAKKVPSALKWLIKEMEHRYEIFATAGARNIAGFNAKILKDRKEAEKAKELESSLSPEERTALNNIEVPRDPNILMPTEKLPYIVCIIDELADLMMVAPADIETCIARLAQLARAAGIHLIIATQRPSVNVITGVIKANLPCRIAFKVASKVDSRTILDGGGADQLIGRGDMLFIPPGSAQLIRAQAAFLSDQEINKIVDALKVNGPPDFADDVQREIDHDSSDGDIPSESSEEWDDDLVPAAINVLRSSKKASTSMLQRRLRIGYNRAARIMELLEDKGIVGPDNGQNPREILVDLDTVPR